MRCAKTPHKHLLQVSNINISESWVWCTLVILALRKQRWEDRECKSVWSVQRVPGQPGDVVVLCLKTPKQNKNMKCLMMGYSGRELRAFMCQVSLGKLVSFTAVGNRPSEIPMS